MQRDLESNETPQPAEGEEDTSLFESQLSPLGRFFLTVLRGEEDSYLKLAEKWIKNVGIRGEYKHVFLEPFRQAYQLGRPEVKEKINNLWSELYLSDIQPLVTRFPFNRRAESAISPSDLTTVLHPQQGTFWKAFKLFMSPVCRETGGVFTERKCPLGSLRLSKDLLNTVNNITRLGTTLWDEKGLPQPLVLSFKSFPLPALIDKEMVAVLSYLQFGNSSVFGFNQRPAWQKFELEWWKEQPAAVGFEFRTSPETPSIYKAITIPESNWSFHRLLAQGEVVDNDVLVWQVERPEYPSDYLTVKYATKSDPWAVFKLIE
jgi:type VI protein secretion system component VasK